MGEEVEVGKEAAASFGCQDSVTVYSEQERVSRCMAAFTQAREAQACNGPKTSLVRAFGK